MLNIFSEDDFNLTKWCEFMEGQLSQSVFIPTLFYIYYVVIFIVSFIGNLVTCVVIFFDKTMHTATNCYLFNLAIADLIVTCSIVASFFYLPTYSYPWQSLVCKIHHIAVKGFWNFSILIVTALAIERYIAVKYPLTLRTVTWRRVNKVIFWIWMLTIAETAPEFWTVDLIQTEHYSLCFNVPNSIARLLCGILAIITYVIPSIIIIFVYSAIILRVGWNENSQNTTGQIFNQPDGRRVNKVAVTLTISFIVCWFPYFIVRMFFFVYNLDEIVQKGKWFGIWFVIAAINSYLSIVLNPLLFSLISSKFRKSFKNLCKSRLRQLKRRSTMRDTSHHVTDERQNTVIPLM